MSCPRDLHASPPLCSRFGGSFAPKSSLLAGNPDPPLPPRLCTSSCAAYNTRETRMNRPGCGCGGTARELRQPSRQVRCSAVGTDYLGVTWAPHRIIRRLQRFAPNAIKSPLLPSFLSPNFFALSIDEQ
ncbi:hypothetical protein ABZP36_005987 [Zizania latifolia]